MVYKHFNKRLVFRLFIMIALASFIGFCAAKGKSVYLLIFLSVIEFALVYEFIHFLNSTNRQINYFIQAIKNDDTTLRFPINTGNALINDLHKSLNELNVVLQQTKVISQIRERYFKEIIQNIGVGVIVFNDKGFVTEVNPSALELFGLHTLTHLLQLDRVDVHFKEELVSLSNQNKKVIMLRKHTDQIQVVTRCTVISLRDENVKLVTLQDIRGELERKELDSWVKLIRVMSHEIMNSLAPVTSIAQSLRGIWQEQTIEGLNSQNVDHVESTIRGLEVISERGEGLIRFVNSYRMLTKIPTPIFTHVSLNGLFNRLSILVSPMKNDFNVPITFHFPHNDFMIKIDEQLIVQVIINLVKNAVESLTGIENPLIKVEGRKRTSGETEIIVSDNGPGIPEDIADEIFVPFFTTKEGGTGVGLSYSRQILKLHGGSVHFHSEPGKTRFTIVF